MNLNPELCDLKSADYHSRKNGINKVSINVSVNSETLKEIDSAAKKMGINRNDFLIACYMRVTNSYKNKN